MYITSRLWKKAKILVFFYLTSGFSAMFIEFYYLLTLISVLFFFYPGVFEEDTTKSCIYLLNIYYDSHYLGFYPKMMITDNEEVALISTTSNRENVHIWNDSREVPLLSNIKWCPCGNMQCKCNINGRSPIVRKNSIQLLASLPVSLLRMINETSQ